MRDHVLISNYVTGLFDHVSSWVYEHELHFLGPGELADHSQVDYEILLKMPGSFGIAKQDPVSLIPWDMKRETDMYYDQKTEI